MLAPESDRLDYGEQLTPPVGYELHSAIATTYSLDLNALLAVPVALCFHDTLDGDIKGEKLALLEGIGQLQGKLKVFYQKGNITFPPQFNRLFTLLEPFLHPLVPEQGAFSSFHPKLWLLRFTESEPTRKKSKVCYRLIVLSRNLTFGRSWDVAISLDGVLEKKPAKKNENTQWLSFIKKLLNQDKKFVPAVMMKQELDKIVWQSPDKFNEVKIHIGGSKHGRPINIEQKDSDELMVVSPFLKSTGGGINALQWLAGFAPEGSKYLFSRADELNAIGEDKLSEWKCYSINELVVNGEERNEVGDTSTGEEPLKQDLHAKLVINQVKNKAYWHIGSANATAAAMGDIVNSKPRNTEAMISMVGDASKVGAKHLRDQWMPDKGPQLFVQHKFSEMPIDESDSVNKLIRQILHKLISASWTLEGTQEEGDELYTLSLEVNDLQTLHKDVSISVGQLGVAGTRLLTEEMIWQGVELSKISALLPVYVKVESAGQCVEKMLVIEVDLKLEGGDMRQQYIMKAMMDSPEKIMNYLQLLLKFSPDKNQWLSLDGKGNGIAGEFFLSDSPIFEQLMLAASRQPKLLKRIETTLKRFKAADVPVPDEFLRLWKYFRKELK